MLGDSDMDKLEIEFANYQIDNLATTSSSVARVDKQWDMIGQIKDLTTGGVKYHLLTKVMKGILVIPHSNVACERAFSIVRKNKTVFRPNLSIKTLQSLLIEKLSHSGPCHSRSYNSDLIRRAKQATYRSISSAVKARQTSSSCLVNL